MTKKKKPGKAKARSTSEPLSRSLMKVVFGLLLLVMMVLAVAWLADRYLSPKTVVPLQKHGAVPLPEKKTVAGQKGTGLQKFTYEIYPTDEKHPGLEMQAPTPSSQHPPRVAIIVDDLGYDFKMAQQFLAMDTNWTFSILPHSPFGKKIAAAADRKNIETMLHLPMEPEEYPQVDPGPGTLLMNMGPDRLLDELEKDLNFIPGIKGVNNHMGSKMTSNSTKLYQIFSNLKKRNLYFIDSRTTSKTLGKPSARLFQLPFAQRDVFLDHVPEAAFIRKQIRLLIETAKRQGQAVGIVHPHKTTITVLQEEISDIQAQTEIVFASQLVQTVGSGKTK
jgi:polysaccharide deacetylase 2 family uncharacterized protein YibQ